MDRDTETATYEGTPSEPGEPKPSARRPAPLQVRDPARYEIIAEHGRGGIGRVLRATDREFGRDVALKELLIRTSVSETRFLREVLITARLEHPNIVPVHEAGRWPDGTPFYAMKLVSGRPLRALIDDARTYGERLAILERVLAIVDAVAYAHDRGVIHRDLKPSNVVIGEYGETIVIDWGLAKVVSDVDAAEGVPDEVPASRSPDVTTAGSVVGTPGYMAPEQASGDIVTERSDVYALGAIVRDVLGGKATSGGDAAVAGLDADVPGDLRSIVQRAMAPAPADRYPNAKDFGDDLRRFLAGEAVSAHRYSATERTARWLTSHRRLVQGIAAVTVALLAASVWFLARESRLRDASDEARKAAEEARRAAEEAQVVAESERKRADRQTLALLEQQGRTELAAGRPFRAAPFLVEAHRRDPDSEPVRWLLTESLRAFDALTTTFNVTPAPSAHGEQQDPYTYSVSLSPDDSELVTGHGHSIAFWEPTTGAPLRRLQLPWHSNHTRHSADGRRLFVFVGYSDGEAPSHILDAATGKELLAIQVGAAAEWVSWSPDGRYLAAVGIPGRVDVWSTSPPRILFSFSAASNPVWGSLAFSPDGSMLAARGAEQLILVSMSTRRVRRIPTLGEGVRLLEFAPDSRSLLMTMADRSVRLWDTTTGRTLGKLPQHASLPILASFSGDGSMIATVESSGELHLWDVASTIRLANLAPQTGDQTYSLVFAHHTPRLVTTTPDGEIRIWDLPADRWARPLPDHLGRTQAAYTAGGTRLVTLDEGEHGRGRLRVWRTSHYQLEHSSTIVWDPACRIDVSADGRRIAVGASDGRVTILDVISGKTLLAVESGPEALSAVALSPDARRLATASAQDVARVWSGETGAPTGITLRAEKGGLIHSVGFSPDGRHLLTTGHGKLARIWDATSGRLVLELPNSRSTFATYSADGQRVITAGWGGEFRPQVWDSSTGQFLMTLEANSSVSAALSPDGTIAATIRAGAVQISSATTGALLRTIEGPNEFRLGGTRLPVHTISFSPDGKRLLTTGTGYVLIWNIELDVRSPAEAAAVVAAKSPWQLVDGRLMLTVP